MKVKDAEYAVLFRTLAYSIISFLSLICLFPLLLILSGSFTNNESIFQDGYHIIPKVFGVEGYQTVFRFPSTVITAYGVTIFVTIVGTVVGLFLITMAGYVLQRKDFKYRNTFTFFIYFTTLFQGGLVPWYILLTKHLQLLDTYTVLIFPALMSPFLIILMRTFIKSSIPEEVIESAKMDGANDFMIYYRIILQLALPGMATVGLFLAINYWNDWFLTSLFITSQDKYQLQFFLLDFMNSAAAARDLGAGTGVNLGFDVPIESTKMAMAVVVTGPIIFLYPFVQRFFVKGLTIGAVKG